VVGALMTDTQNSVAALLLIALSYPVYRVVRRGAAAGDAVGE